MNNFENSSKEIGEDGMLERFRDRISEMKKMGDNGVYFSAINPQELTLEDVAIYEKLENGTIGFGDLERYEATILEEERDINGIRGVKNGVPRSRFDFLDFIKNKSTPIIARRELANGGK